jgi:hypothetical protein
MHHELAADGITGNEVVDLKPRDAVLDGFIVLEYVTYDERGRSGRM